ncbi:hypothetical protein H1R16_03985 [Marnyiella aurantia]|uniref:Glycosyltransferase n=1 Tax=Marnyiella aurantia TaxID=2758037 RepID=A0A7D7LUG0_9FLAO|nr:hypothetical protein [Marnyiella aurantia]MBA5247418.1 hypothetical protein [Marnyiella aurantia]MBP0612974.1 hypothetical protein [Marnyiella aurantia]QMS99175.1 hypothetical protein H1R16_03985 [Marnyiella aurantia]
MDNKEIVVLHKTSVSDFPPILSLLRYLKKNGYRVHLVLGYERTEAMRQELHEMCETLHITNIVPSKNKILYWLKIRRTFWRIINENNYTSKLIWLPAADTTLALGSKLLNCNYVLNLYELFDDEPLYLKRLKKFALKAKMVICSNDERAHILRVWWKLPHTPKVILNKPYTGISGRNLPLPKDIEDKIRTLDGTKIIIYQGMIRPERDLEGLCKVLTERPEFSLIVMGPETQYLQKLLAINPAILYIPFVAPPYHLHITSHAHIGVLSYDHSSLNNIFCAPNKLWEFSNFELPMLGNNIPGLYNTIETNKMGRCADFIDRESVISALSDIIENYDDYASRASEFYNSYDYDAELSRILSKLG